jgi:hypothetical protein
MGALAGFILGYALGMKAGPQGYEELRKAWQEISSTEEFKGLVAAGTAFLENLLAQGRGTVATQLGAIAAPDGELRQAWQKLSGDGEIIDAWQTISSSGEFRALVSSGLSLINGVLDRRTAH